MFIALICVQNSGISLPYIPSEVFILEHLESLNLSGHKLTQVPDSISSLINLKHLDLSNNGISKLPDSISSLQNLKHLNLSNNKMSKLPDSISQMENLTTLDLSRNGLKKLPYSISKLHNLEFLYLMGNGLSVKLDLIFQMQNLIYIDLRDNAIDTLPDSISKLKNLTHLYLSGNRLASLPESFSELKNLTFLDLRNNNLTSLPYSFFRLKNLQNLSIDKNPIEVPPPEVVNKGVRAIMDYFIQIESEGEDYLYEAKLLIVGEGGAGKTTLTKKVIDQEYELKKYEASTEGIDVVNWDFPLESGNTFKVNIWDFGGQEIYHSTHQFFLTKRSLYALVADTRKEDTDFYYWLNVVEILSDNSPLLIIKNEKQDRRREINERQLRGEFTNLEKILATNLATNRGLPEILYEIKHRIQNLPHIGTALPKSWVDVRKMIESDSRNYISADEFFDICEQNGFTEHKNKLQLSGYLHDLGVCLHFQEDPLLKKTVILSPTWGTDAVYAALDNKKVIGNFGSFTKSDLSEIWDSEKYANMHDELLQLMINFQLCYKIPGTKDKYIAPQLLSENQPSYDWNDKENIILRYTYEFMPKGIITRFIVAMHSRIADQRLVWKSGVILKKDRAEAEIIENYSRREIRVRITGKNKKELMTIITYELDNIHDSFKRLKYKKLIPCNCKVCKISNEPHFYEFEKLRRFTDDGQNRIQCQESYEMVDVLNLIDDVLGNIQTFEQQQQMRASQGVFIEGSVEHLVIQQSEKGNNIMEDKKNGNEQVKSAWANGSFYLFSFSIVIILLGVLARYIPLYSLPVVLVAGGIFIPLIGVLQLRQDDKLSEKSFSELIKLVIGQLPLIGKRPIPPRIEQ